MLFKLFYLFLFMVGCQSGKCVSGVVGDMWGHQLESVQRSSRPSPC